MCPWPKKAPLTLTPLKGLGGVGRGTQGVFAGDKSYFRKIIRQEVQSDAVLSHLLLPPCEYNPGPVPRPRSPAPWPFESHEVITAATAAGPHWPGNKLAGVPSPAGRKCALTATQTPPRENVKLEQQQKTSY